VATAEHTGNTTPARPMSLLSDEICELPPNPWECSHIIRPLALDGHRMAQAVVSGQGFPLTPSQHRPDCGNGCLHTGQCFSPGLTSRLALHLGQVTLISLMPVF